MDPRMGVTMRPASLMACSSLSKCCAGAGQAEQGSLLSEPGETC